jgi:two-component system OmpR family sensor kinase
MMASLRGRLLVTLLGVAAIGLLLLGAITYFEQRSFLLTRLDQEVFAARGPVQAYLADKGIGPSRSESGRFPPHRANGGGPGSGLPLGAYGQRRDASGKFIGDAVFAYDETIKDKPAVPANLPLDRIITVSGAGNDTRYRLLASEEPRGQGTIVVAIPLTQTNQILQRLLLVESLVIGGVLLLLGVVAAGVVRVGLLPLDRMGHTAGAIAGGDLSHRVEPTDPRSEVGRLGIALNAMLDRLERAFAEREASENRLRQFLADASHELRTPLASIRGYAELFRMGAAREPADIAKAMRRIEDEASRMGVLVEDLLTLARLDEIADAPHAEVDLGRIAGDAVDDARATAPDRRISLEAARGARVHGDAHQLRQVLANLLRNAVVHTPPGTAVDVAVTRADGRVRLEVRDHGPGLPSEDSGEIFARFWRAERGRERGKAGAGLGLAIVAGIVEHHGGEVSAVNAEDGGARFTVELPAR